jgi:aspartate 1-decarboxylase
MLRTFMKAKIHRATVTEVNIHYVGSVTLDPRMMEAAGILPYEQVDVYNVTNGNRLTTYAIESKRRGGGEVCLNGAAARLCRRGDIVLIVAYCQLADHEVKDFKAVTAWVDRKNKVTKVKRDRIWKKR